MAPTEKRCLYEILGVQRDSTPDEIRSAYRKLALQRHPDKLKQSGVSEADATASFQELVNAYEVLSDPRERSWYDSHRSQILFAGSATSNSSSSIPDLFSFFSNSVFSGYSDTGKGFYKVYGDIFDKIFRNELNFAKKLGLELGTVKEAPVMGNLKSPYTQVTAFYGYWLGFVTVMDFCWVDQYDAMAGVNRKSRRVMEDENKKLRKKARREYNDTVRGLAEFVKKRDKRVIDMQVKRNEEIEKKREEEKERKKQLEKEKMERAQAYEEPDWAKVDDEEDIQYHEVEDEKKKDELYCVVCSKKFKSEKQWKNHEQSKKHKDKVAELREAFGDEDLKNEKETEEDNVGSVLAENGVDDLSEKFEDSIEIQKENTVEDEAISSEEDEFVDVENGDRKLAMDEQFGFDDDDEASILAAMVSGHKSKKISKSSQSSEKISKSSQSKTNTSSAEASGEKDDVDDEMDFMAYNNMKSTRKKRGTKKDRGRRYDEETTTADNAEISEQSRDENGAQEAETSPHDFVEKKHDSGVQEAETSPHASVDNGQESNLKEDAVEKVRKVPKQPADKKVTSKKDANAKSKNATKGKKQKATSKSTGTVCEKCGEDFDTRNRLYRHLDESGHATLKSR